MRRARAPLSAAQVETGEPPTEAALLKQVAALQLEVEKTHRERAHIQVKLIDIIDELLEEHPDEEDRVRERIEEILEEAVDLD